MQFSYCENAGKELLKIDGEAYNHIYQSRRTKHTQKLFFRNLLDENLYTYEHIEITKNHAQLRLCEFVHSPKKPISKIHLIWSIIESKTIEKTLPFLNQIGVEKISFFYANRSQKNQKISLEKLQKILIHSCEQCGRSSLMDLEILSNTKEALKNYSKAYVFDFGGKDIHTNTPKLEEGIFIGPEGGFDPEEKELLKTQECFESSQGFILKSECAAIFLASLGLKSNP